jgi:hypothetical protein
MGVFPQRASGFRPAAAGSGVCSGGYNDPLNKTDPLGLRPDDTDLFWGLGGESRPLAHNGGSPLPNPGHVLDLQWEWEPPRSRCRGTLTHPAYFRSQYSPRDNGHIGNQEENSVQVCFSRTASGGISIDYIVISQQQYGCTPATDLHGGIGGSVGPADVADPFIEAATQGTSLGDLLPAGVCSNAPKSRWEFSVFYADNVWGARRVVEIARRDPCGGLPEDMFASGAVPECLSKGKRGYAMVVLPGQRMVAGPLNLRVAHYPLSGANSVITGAESGGEYSAASLQFTLTPWGG